MSDMCAARCRQDETAQPCGTYGGTVIDRQVLLVCVCGSAECRRERPRLVGERPECARSGDADDGEGAEAYGADPHLVV